MVIIGQYYVPVNLDKKQYLEPHKYDNGMKLMEHSWIGNKFVATVESLITKGGDWYGDRIVWAGDYMDEGLYLEHESHDAEDNLYSFANEHYKEIEPHDELQFGRYLVNHTRMEYVDKSICPVTDSNDNGAWIVHPLPLLMSSGNGRGGGDYHDCYPGYDMVGDWAGDKVTVEKDIADFVAKNFNEIEPGFQENE